MFCLGKMWIFGQYQLGFVQLCVQMQGQCGIVFGLQMCGVVFDLGVLYFGYLCGGCVFVCGIWKDMQEGQVVIIDQFQVVFKYCFGFGWEIGDDVGIEDDVWMQMVGIFVKVDGIVVQVVVFYLFQDYVIVCLQGQVQMWYQVWFGGDGQYQVFICFDVVDVVDVQVWQIWYQLQDVYDQIVQFWLVWQICVLIGQIDVGQYYFVEVMVVQVFDLVDYYFCWD